MLQVVASTNDPAQRVSTSGMNELVIAGTATNGGSSASYLTVQVGADCVRVPLRRGDSAEQTAHRLAWVMPRQYFTQVIPGRGAGFPVMVRVLARTSRHDTTARLS